MSQTADVHRLNTLRIVGWSLAAAILLVPLIAMQFTPEMNWGAEDFLAAALLLGGAGLAIEAMVRLVRGTGARAVGGLVILSVVALIWAQLAVGIF